MLHNTVIPKLLSLFVLFFIAGALQAEDEPLMPNEAFKFSAKMIDANTARVEWNVVKKYYLYRDKISFSSGTPGIDIGTVSLPKGKLKHGIRPDGSEGEVETFIGKLTINVPLRRTNPNLKEFTLIAKSQGCAEIGICYPPHKQQATLKLPAAGNNKTSAVKQINTLSNLLGVSNNQDILTADEAFQVNVTAEDGNTIVARWVIAPKHYMYRDKINVKLKDVSGVRLADVVIPAGEEKHDEVFKKTMQVFHDHAEARIKLARSKTEPMDIALELTWQGCAEEVGICYPPVKKQLTVSLPAGGSAAPAAASGESTFSMERFNRILDQGNLLLVMLATMAAGIILAFTACMYPMIPILSSIIVGQGEKATAAKGLGLSLIYVGSMAVTFGVIGAIMAGVSGGVGLQAYFQSPWMLIPFAVLFIALSMAMFGFYNIQIPAFIQSRLTTISNQQQGGNLAGVAIMGILSALIIGPCGGPILIAALSYAASSGNVFNGFVALFSLGMGMGLPLLVVGAGGSKLLPRAGDWMNIVKATAGVILLAVAIVILERMPNIFPPALTMLLWAALIIVSGITMGALEPLTIESTGMKKFWKGIGFTLLIYGTIVMLGGLTGGKYVTDPLHGSSLTSGKISTAVASTAGGGNHTADLGFKRIKSVADLDRELKAAKQQGKLVMLDFYADWCLYCKEYESYVFPKADVQQRLKKMVLLQADVTAQDADDKALMQRTSVILPPAILFIDTNGAEQKQFRIVGSMKAEQFVRHVDKVLAK